MKVSPKLWLTFIALLSVGTVTFFFMAAGPDSATQSARPKSPERTNPTVEVQPSLNLPSPTSATVANSLENPPAAEKIVAPSSQPPVKKEEILSVIEEASISYSAEELPKIQPYLSHPDPEVRAAAIQGMITIGEPAAAPILRAAAQLAASTEEAKAMKEAADYVELPPGSMLKK
ncbi:MAG: HEAT repeat domain-containing protein [Prosthecobacter sp.]|nr:HEAT repeat domain-containing protein [Prosthecobacter sp.]